MLKFKSWIKKTWRKLFPVIEKKIVVTEFLDMSTEAAQTDPNLLLIGLTNCWAENPDLQYYIGNLYITLNLQLNAPPSLEDLDLWKLKQLQILSKIEAIKMVLDIPRSAKELIMKIDAVKKEQKQIEEDQAAGVNTNWGDQKN